MPKPGNNQFNEDYKLNAKEIAFCEAYLNNGFVISKAAEEAGYKPSKKVNFSCIGSEVIRKPEVRRYIKDRLDLNVNRFDEVMANLTEIALGNKKDEIPLLENGSQYLAEKNIDNMAQVKAASEIIKYKQFLDKLEREDIDREDRKKNDNIIIENMMRQLAKEERELDKETYDLSDEE